MERKQVTGYRMELFSMDSAGRICPSPASEAVRGAAGVKALQVASAGEQGRALVYGLMETVCRRDNINRACQRVKSSQGVCGTDGMDVRDFALRYRQNGGKLPAELQSGSYHPQGVKTVEIPKPDGGKRRPGIPAVIDRVIRQAMARVPGPLYGPDFSSHSCGFRPHRNARRALQEAGQYVSGGNTTVADIDLKNFFDTVHRDRLMYRLSTGIGDRVLLKLIRRYLQSGILTDGVLSRRTEGTPQGSPLSPLLSSIVLDELDRELERL